ncbi:MAG: hypothetical protein AAFP82_21490, partial [Bacteroidota bacterium]
MEDGGGLSVFSQFFLFSTAEKNIFAMLIEENVTILHRNLHHTFTHLQQKKDKINLLTNLIFIM